jgi:hypothetical protein
MTSKYVTLAGGGILTACLLDSIFRSQGDIVFWGMILYLFLESTYWRNRTQRLQKEDNYLCSVLLKDLYQARDNNPWTTLHQYISYREHVGAIIKRPKDDA